MCRRRCPSSQGAPGVAPGITVVRQIVGVSDIRVEAFIGVHSHENDRRQSLIIDAQLTVTAPEGDSIADTVDYNSVVAQCRLLADRRIGLIETFARLLGAALFEDPRVMRAEITVTKPGALANGVARATATLARQPHTA